MDGLLLLLQLVLRRVAFCNNDTTVAVSATVAVAAAAAAAAEGHGFKGVGFGVSGQFCDGSLVRPDSEVLGFSGNAAHYTFSNLY